MGYHLSYIPPVIADGSVEVHLEKSEIDEEVERWKCALIVHVIGETPGYMVVKKYIETNWITAARPDIFLHEDGYYIVKFQSLDDLSEILYSGPYSINNRPIILKQWSPDYDHNAAFLTEVPLWVTFPKLPMNYWSCASLSRIASAVGVPLYADECIAKQTRISYARMLIEVNVTKPLVREILLKDPSGRELIQVVNYEWAPAYCNKYMCIGHDCIKLEERQKQEVQKQENNRGRQRTQKQQAAQTGKKTVTQWQPKDKVEVQNQVEQQLQAPAGNGKIQQQTEI